MTPEERIRITEQINALKAKGTQVSCEYNWTAGHSDAWQVTISGTAPALNTYDSSLKEVARVVNAVHEAYAGRANVTPKTHWTPEGSLVSADGFTFYGSVYPSRDKTFYYWAHTTFCSEEVAAGVADAQKRVESLVIENGTPQMVAEVQAMKRARGAYDR